MMRDARSALGALWQWIGHQWENVWLFLEALGLEEPADPAIDPLEGAMQSALQPVSPSDVFRQQLGENLSLAAQYREEGLSIEESGRARQAILLSASAAVLALSIGTAVAISISRSRPSGVSR